MTKPIRPSAEINERAKRRRELERIANAAKVSHAAFSAARSGIWDRTPVPAKIAHAAINDTIEAMRSLLAEFDAETERWMEGEEI